MDGYGKPSVTIRSRKQIQKLIQIRGVSGTKLVCTETLHVDVALKFAIALFEHN